MAIATIDQAILRGQISTYLAANDNAVGDLFGKRIASPISPVTIAMVTDALDWGNAGGAQTDESLRNVANYLVWLCGRFGQEAEAISSGAGGGTVVPGGSTTTNVYPIYITSSDFEPDGIRYNNPNIVGDNLIIFVNEFSQQWLVAGPNTFSYSATGIIMNIPGWDANTQQWSLVIEKYNN